MKTSSRSSPIAFQDPAPNMMPLCIVIAASFQIMYHFGRILAHYFSTSNTEIKIERELFVMQLPSCERTGLSSHNRIMGILIKGYSILWGHIHFMGQIHCMLIQSEKLDCTSDKARDIYILQKK